MATSPYPPAKNPEKATRPILDDPDSYSRIEGLKDGNLPVDDPDDEDEDIPDTE